MPPDLLSHLPQGWVGFFAIAMFTIWSGAQVVEKFPVIAKHIPLGKWWHDRQKSKVSRREVVAEDNEIIAGMQVQITGILAELAGVHEKLRVFTAFSVYDARYHHRIEVAHADGDCVQVLPRHYDFFEFERLWKTDPLSTATL